MMQRLLAFSIFILLVLVTFAAVLLPFPFGFILAFTIYAIVIYKLTSKIVSLQQANDDLESRNFRRTRQFKKELTEKMDALEERNFHREQLQKNETYQTLGVLAMGIAHEINNPNNFIKLSSDVLKDVVTELVVYLGSIDEFKNKKFAGLTIEEIKEDLPSLVAGISDGCERIEKIINSLKTYTQKSSGEMKPFEINKVIHDCIPLVQNLISQKTDHFQLKLEEVPMVSGDARQIEQVLINLIQNACLALKSAESSIIVSTFSDEENVIIEVKDEGCGISAKNLDNVVKPFFTTRRNDGGTGLGLSISHNIVNDHEGKMTFTSEEGQGTVVRILLPKLKR